jgi:hypothetical protein
MNRMRAALFLALLGAPLLANQRVSGNCELGGNVVVTQGLNATPKVQASYPGCTVTVYQTGTIVLATIYSDNLNTPLSNPFTANLTTGQWFWYAANGRYDVKLSGAGITTNTVGDILLSDPDAGLVFTSSLGADIRAYGATCDWNGSTGTNNFFAVQNALSAGWDRIVTPRNCMWIPTGGVIPSSLANPIVYIGESMATSVVMSNSNPSSTVLQYGPGATLENLNLRGSTTNDPNNCPTGYAINSSDLTQQFISTCNSSFDSISGLNNTDRTGVFFKVGSEPSGLTGDALNASNCVGSPGCMYTGNSLRADNYAGVGGYAAILATAMPGAADATAVIQISNFTGAGSNPGLAGSPVMLSISDPYRTSGHVIQLYQYGSNWTGGGAFIFADMAAFSGTSTADFIQFFNGSTKVFEVGDGGLLTMPNFKALTGTRYLCIDTNGNVSSSASACSGT